MAQHEHTLLTTGQAAKLCEVTPDTILKWIRKGKLHGTRTAGGHYRINPQDLEPHVPEGRLVQQGQETPRCLAQQLHCWEYLSDGGAVRDDCKRCVVYRVRAAQCFQMAEMETDVGHAKQFCRDSCEDCVYFRRVQGMPTNVLVISRDETLADRLLSEENPSIALRLARTGYEASAIIQQFQPAFVVVDEELLTFEGGALLESLAADSRLAGVKIVLSVRHGTAHSNRGIQRSDLVFSVIEKPFGPRRIAAVINSFPIERNLPADLNVR